MGVVACDEDGCPFVETGRCLEGFANGAGCPHLLSVAEGDEDTTSLIEEAPSVESVVAGPATSADVARAVPADATVELGGDESLTLREAELIANRWTARLVLILGEHNAGKTSLLAELYGRFLNGPYESWAFAGSNSLIAFDKRHQGARGPDTSPSAPDHTVDEGMRFLDLRLVDEAGQFRSLLLSDIQGEYIRHVVEGAPILEDIPIAPRADQAAVVVDGDRLADRATRNETISNARLLIGALTDDGITPVGRPLAIVLTKSDVLDSAALNWFQDRAESLATFASDRGADPAVLITSAMPADHTSPVVGIEAWLAWLVQAPDNPPRAALRSEVAPRSFWRLGEGGVRG